MASVDFEALLAKPSPVRDLLKQPTNLALGLVRERERAPPAEQLLVLARVEDFCSRRLYHELTLAFAEYCRFPVSNPLAYAGLFLSVMVPRFTHLNEREFARTACVIADMLPALDAVQFMAHVFKGVDLSKMPAVLIVKQAQLCRDCLRLDNVVAAETCADKAQEAFDDSFGLPVEVSAAWHHSKSLLHLAMRELTEAYEHRMLYLKYVRVESIPVAERAPMALSLLEVSLVCKDRFTFGEVMALPLVRLVRDSPAYPLKETFEAVAAVCDAFVASSLPQYRMAVDANSAVLSSRSLLTEHSATVEEKIRMLALMSAAFAATAGKLTFKEIADVCLVDPHQVELLVMSAIKSGLFHGQIDQVAEEVSVVRVRSQVLSREGVAVLAERTRRWADLARGLSQHLDNVAAGSATFGV